MNAHKEIIGFVGIGTMGTPMAGNLARAGYKLVAFDLDAARTAALAKESSVTVAASLAELGSQANIIITMLPDGKAVRTALCGKNDSFKDCLLERAQKNALIIDMSSSSPLGTRELGALLEQRGYQIIDAPVSNGLKGAVAATLSIMVGGDKSVFERVKPLLEKMGNQIYHAGPLGAGHAIKALNNYVSAAGLVAACEAVIAAERFGLDTAVATDIINASSGMNNTTRNKVKQHMLSNTFGSGFTTALMAKDVRTALEVVEATGTTSDLARHCAAFWTAAEDRLPAGKDHTAVYQLIKDRK
ncbi:MAG: NAD(P)-dependent oxidoreductase [Betaproteobacteria bacterium]|jgi:3-hydroxyisobutyrate dehydrogenase|nr:NAD(P)-dependent oxidoreductase [Betaproteobacteria bacterium]MDH4293238.1 NAD(P)-dependent oxidoreductase [Betaproteobacteria bacterium]MDH5342887.1 NAD(P)-dependent oxidoreductase [Betaproteobacteria bacterium]